MTDKEKLLSLAEWFDAYDMKTKGHINNNTVQSDLRRIAETLPTPSDPSQDSVAGVSADISVSDLRKVFAHRSSRIVEDLNQGANQLMTLTDFRLAVADMGWRIGFDQLADKDREILHLNDVIKSAQAEIELLKQTAPKLVLPEEMPKKIMHHVGYNQCLKEIKRLNPHLITE